MNKLGIIIINYNSPEDTLACIHSVEKYAKDLHPLLLVYDNSEINPLSRSQLSIFNLDIRFFRNSNNLGFAGAVNQGLKTLKEGGFAYFFLLNNDVLLVDKSLERMVECLDNEHSISIVGGINYFMNQPEIIWQSGCHNNWLTGSVKSITPSQSFTKVDYVPGSTFLGRMELVGKIGYFDEQFFHYFEENDYCQRTRKIGGEIAILAKTRFLHKVDGRDRKDSPFIFYYMTRNQLLFLRKHRSFLNRLFPFIWLHGYNFLRSLKYDIKNQNTGIIFLRTYYYAIIDFWKGRSGKSNYIQDLVHKKGQRLR